MMTRRQAWSILKSEWPIADDLHFVLEWLKHPLCRELLRYAYFRDGLLQSFLNIWQFFALQLGDHSQADRVAKLRRFWERCDKGALASNGIEREALTLCRKLYLYQMVQARTSKQRKQQEAELFKALLDAAKNPECLAKANQFRLKRRAGGFTEEGDLRADLSAIGVLGQLYGKTFPDSDTLMEQFDPFRHTKLVGLRVSKKEFDQKNAKNLERNWRKLLDECQVTPRKQRKRGPRNLGTG
jgi:hypothetical protein